MYDEYSEIFRAGRCHQFLCSAGTRVEIAVYSMNRVQLVRCTIEDY